MIGFEIIILAFAVLVFDQSIERPRQAGLARPCFVCIKRIQ